MVPLSTSCGFAGAISNKYLPIILPKSEPTSSDGKSAGGT
jgi:hypothetical protein